MARPMTYMLRSVLAWSPCLAGLLLGLVCLVGGLLLVNMVQEHARRKKEPGGVGDPLPRDVRSRPVDGLEDGVPLAGWV